MKPAGWHIRVASAPRWGGGHAARMLVLARALAAAKKNGPAISFHLDAVDGHRAESIGAAGFAVSLALPPAAFGAALLDHPDRDLLRREGWIGRDAAAMGFVAALDDAGKVWSGADLMVHPHADLAADELGGIPCLAGARFALIDPAWSDLRPPAAEAPVSTTLVAFGLIDSVDATGHVLSALRGHFPAITRVDVAIGDRAAHRSRIAALAGSDPRCRLHIGLADLKPLVAAAGLCIGACGQSIQERIAAGAVNMVVAQNPEQAVLLADLAARGVVADGGSVEGFDSGRFRARLAVVLADGGARARMAGAARRLIDGGGAARLAQELHRRAAHRA